MAADKPSTEVSDLLAPTIEMHLGPATVDRALVHLLCEDAVDFARDFAPTRVGQRARAAATLMLELGCPQMSASLRKELAVICELTAIGAIGRLQDL